VRVGEILGSVRAVGAVPILATLPPNGDGMTFINAANAMILSRAFGDDVIIVDYAAALSVGNDRETLNASLFLGDNTHPNVAGHAAMAAQFEADCPMAFD
jgi:lysophospholipase L1-like esterase